MGIFGNDEGHEEIDLDAELAEVAEHQAVTADDLLREPKQTELVRVRVIAQHNGLRRGDIISVVAERAENMVKSGVGEVID